jgi:3-oxoacyl-[acyl-carrier protein] reductase
MNPIQGKVALVTGGNRGIGRGIAEALAAGGATVVLTARAGAAAEQAAKEIGGPTLGFACDVRSQEQVERLFRRIDETAGGPDILVNNAGVGLFGPVAEMDPEAWRTVIETNLNGVFYCCHEAVPRMRRRGGGYIINISSLAGKNPLAKGFLPASEEMLRM